MLGYHTTYWLHGEAARIAAKPFNLNSHSCNKTCCYGSKVRGRSSRNRYSTANVTMFAIPSAPVPRRSIPIGLVSAALTKRGLAYPITKPSCKLCGGRSSIQNENHGWSDLGMWRIPRRLSGTAQEQVPFEKVSSSVSCTDQGLCSDTCCLQLFFSFWQDLSYILRLIVLPSFQKVGGLWSRVVKRVCVVSFGESARLPPSGCWSCERFC